MADEATFSASAILKLKEEYTRQLYEKEGHPQECPSFFCAPPPRKSPEILEKSNTRMP